MNVCERAIDEIEKRGWYQGGFEGPGGSVCALGAMKAAMGLRPDALALNSALNYDQFIAARMAFERVMGENVASWNDTPGRTEDDVLEALRLTSKELSK